MRHLDLTGRRFGNLVAVCYVGFNNGKRPVSAWLVRCDCGTEKTVRTGNLQGGRTVTCRGATCRFSYAKRVTVRSGARVPAQQHIFVTYKRKALKGGKEFTLTREHFLLLIESNCYYCGRLPQNKSVRARTPYFYNGLDRADSNRGYSIDNVRPCCWICNRMKHVLSEAEFFTHMSRILEYSAKRETA